MSTFGPILWVVKLFSCVAFSVLICWIVNKRVLCGRILTSKLTFTLKEYFITALVYMCCLLLCILIMLFAAVSRLIQETAKTRNKMSSERTKGTSSPKVGVGEIDTSAPFQSVKDAVNLFGEVAFSGERPAIKQVKPHSAERVFAKETQLHLAEKELNKLKQNLQNAENTKSESLLELEKARQTAEELTVKLQIINESKEVALMAMESAKVQAKQLEEANSGSIAVNNADQQQNLECATAEYANVSAELNAAKAELANIRQECDTYSEAKVIASQKVEEAENAAKVNLKRAQEIHKEISDAREMIEQLRQATSEGKQELAKLFAEKEVERQTYKANFEKLESELQEVRRGFDPDLTKKLEGKLAETLGETHTLQKEMEDAKASDTEALITVKSGLNGAKESLQSVLQEETDLRQWVESLKFELENLKKEHAELRKKEAETESVAGNLHVKLRMSKSELENCLLEEAKARGTSDEMIATLSQLSSETEHARLEAERLKARAEELEREAQETRASLEEAEKLLVTALEQAEQAKLAEESALEQINVLSERTNTARSSTSGSGAKITISRDEFKSLSQKTEESAKLAELKVAAAFAQAEAIKASESEKLKKLEVARKEMEDMKTATQEALKRAEMAEAAKKAVEGELRKWREREQKKAAEAAASILEQAQAYTEGNVSADTKRQPTGRDSPIHYEIQKQKSETLTPTKKMDRQRPSFSKKATMPNLGGIFHKKKSQIEVGLPSYLPGESPF